jgi:hypothetical protein
MKEKGDFGEKDIKNENSSWKCCFCFSGNVERESFGDRKIKEWVRVGTG